MTFRTITLALLAGALVGCGAEPEPEGPRALFDLQLATQDLYAIPFPNDLRLRSDRTIDLAGFEQGLTPLVAEYVRMLVRNRLGGFALNGGVFFRFREAIDPASLPRTPAASLEPGAAISWVDIEKGSPDYGKRIPLQARFVGEQRKHIGPHTLAVLPVIGFTLRPVTRYAVLLTSSLTSAAGSPARPDPDFAALLDAAEPAQPALRGAHAVYRPLREYLKETGRGGVISAAVFSTGAPTTIAERARRVVRRDPAPVAQGVTGRQETATYHELEGTYQASNFQQGTVPYVTPDQGGDITLDASGDPLPARQETLRFSIAVPRGPMPAAGWPLVIYAHGTGGDYRSYAHGGTAAALAEVKDEAGAVVSRLAVISIDQNLHGTRAPPGTLPELVFYNALNPVAWVANVLQSGIDNFSLLRLAQGLTIADAPWGAESGKSGSVTFDPPARFDPQRIFFYGHSQGAQTGPVFVAHEPLVRGLALSAGGGSSAIDMLDRSAPISNRALLSAALQLPLDETFDIFHPMINLLQQVMEPVDSLNYGRLFRLDVPQGGTPKHVLLTEGFVDHYVPAGCTEALATAIGVPLVEPALRPVPGLELRGLQVARPPLSGNLAVGGVKLTGALLQYTAATSDKACAAPSDCTSSQYCGEHGRCADEGHFVTYTEPRAIRQYTRFLATLARDGVPTIAP